MRWITAPGWPGNLLAGIAAFAVQGIELTLATQAPGKAVHVALAVDGR